MWQRKGMGKLSGDSSGAGEVEGTPKASGVMQNPGGDCQGVGEGVESLRGTKTHGLEELSQRDKTSSVTLKGDRVMRTDGRKGEGRWQKLLRHPGH